jgi:drug/metabolite transporter (DMT)-like permease
MGIIVSFAGQALIVLRGNDGLRFEPGALLVLGAAICQSLFFVLQKPLLRKYSALAVTSFAIWAGAVLMLPLLPDLIAEVRKAPLNSTFAAI